MLFPYANVSIDLWVMLMNLCLTLVKTTLLLYVACMASTVLMQSKKNRQHMMN